MKRSGMLVVSLRGINQGFWSHLGCSCQNISMFSSQSIFKGELGKIIIQGMLFFPFLGSISPGLSSLVY